MSRSAAEERGIAVFDRFVARPGSGYIASGFALGWIIDLVERRRPERILEVGSGIGTITSAVLEARDRTGAGGLHVAVEDGPFCLEQFAANLGPRAAEVVVVPRAADVVAAVGHVAFDLVIVDGGDPDDLAPEERHTFTAEDRAAEVAAWVALVAPGGLVLVANTRAAQRRDLEAQTRRRYAHEHVRPADATPGLHLYWFEPSPARRAAAAARGAANRLWFPTGLRVARTLHRRITGRPMARRRAVASGQF
ncbi:MAG: hypothetical protein R2746_15775 [Acidimicrobiales bacterium]